MAIAKKILIIFLLSILLLPATVAVAQSSDVAPSQDPCSDDFCLNVPIGGLKGFSITNSSENIMGKYIEVWYNLLLGTIGIIATIMIMWGGMKWLVSRGDKGEITSAQNTIASAITGLILAFGSFAILNLINPALLTIRMPSLPIINAGKDAMNNAGGTSATTGSIPGSAYPANLPNNDEAFDPLYYLFRDSLRLQGDSATFGIDVELSNGRTLNTETVLQDNGNGGFNVVSPEFSDEDDGVSFTDFSEAMTLILTPLSGTIGNISYPIFTPGTNGNLPSITFQQREWE